MSLPAIILERHLIAITTSAPQLHVKEVTVKWMQTNQETVSVILVITYHSNKWARFH